MELADTDVSGESDTPKAATNGTARRARPTLFTKENAAEMGRRGGKKSVKTRREAKQPKTLEWLKENKDILYNRLYEAAFGQGAFSDLPSDKQLQALKLLTERVDGRPATKSSNDEQPEQANDGWTIGVATE